MSAEVTSSTRQRRGNVLASRAELPYVALPWDVRLNNSYDTLPACSITDARHMNSAPLDAHPIVGTGGWGDCMSVDCGLVYSAHKHSQSVLGDDE